MKKNWTKHIVFFKNNFRSDPNIFCTIPPEMIAEFEESKRIATAKGKNSQCT